MSKKSAAARFAPKTPASKPAAVAAPAAADLEPETPAAVEAELAPAVEPEAVETELAAPPAPEVASDDAAPSSEPGRAKKTAPENLPPGRRRFAAKSALRAAVSALDAFGPFWAGWGVDDLGPARDALRAAVERLDATTVQPRAKRAGIAVGGRVRLTEKAAGLYRDALDEGDAEALTVAAITGGMVRLSTPSGTRLVVPSKALVAA